MIRWREPNGLDGHCVVCGAAATRAANDVLLCGKLDCFVCVVAYLRRYQARS